MAHLEEVIDKMADTRLSEPAAEDEDAFFDAVTSALPPPKGQTVEEVWKDLNASPLFMTELEENDDVAALQALAYDGTALENATNFKEQGNECFRERRWADAKEFYTKGIDILAPEERRRARGGGAAGPEAETDEEIRGQRAVLETLHANRAACHLELRNYRSCTLDCAAALRLNPGNVKALYRSSRALLAVDRVAEADDACARGLALDGGNAALQAAADAIARRSEALGERARREDERRARERRRARLLAAALRARGIRTRETDRPPEMEDARLRLVPDPDSPQSTLAFPTVLLYPAHLETDFIKAFNETETLEEHLAYVFPLPWDREGAYTAAGVECYMETLAGGLVKVGRKVPLLKVLGTGKVEVVDGVVRLFVVPRARAEAFIKDYKAKKAAEMNKP